MSDLNKTCTINFTINAPTKPFYEVFGYKSYDDYYNALHFIAKYEDGTYYCASCKDKECPLLNKNQSNDK